MLNRAVVALIESLVRLNFPSLTVAGEEHLPAEGSGPVLYVLNHGAALLDPIVLRLATHRPVRFLGKSTLFANPVGKFTMESFGGIPIYRRQDVSQGGGDPSQNERTFALCREALGRGESLALFPEGVSHADARLKPLKTGAARIALSSLAAGEGAATGLRIVPVGIAYEDRATFRSRAFVQIGPPLDPSAHLDAYRGDEHAAVNALTAQLSRALASVLPQADTREVLDGVAAVAGWVSEEPAGGARDDYAERVRRGREMLDAFETLRERDPALASAVLEEARAYARALGELGVSDPWALEPGHVSARAAARVGAKLALLAGPALVGAAMGWAPYRLAGELAKKYSKGYEDMLGTVKLVAGLAVMPAAWGLEALVASLFIGPLAWPLAFTAGPACGYAALRFDETLGVASVAARHLWLRANAGESARELRSKRRSLAHSVEVALRAAREAMREAEGEPEPAGA